MTEQAARGWLSSHCDSVPALEIHHRKALETLTDHSRTIGDLANVVTLDPGMSISLYREVNSKLQPRTGIEVDSIHAALALLGDGAISDLISGHPVFDEAGANRDQRQSLHQLMSRCYHMLAQLEYFVSLQGIRNLDEIRCAALLRNIGEIHTCLFDYGRYASFLDKFHAGGTDVNSARSVFGFDFHELGRQLADRFRLPDLVHESLDEKVPPGRKARLIQLASDLSQQAEAGWYHPSMRATEEVCADFLNQSLNGFARAVQQVALEVARRCPFDDVLSAAARMIMLPDREVVAPTVRRTAASDLDNAPAFEGRIRTLLNSPRATQAQLLDLLLSHLHNDLHLSRVVLLLLSNDKTRLGARAGKGLNQHSPIRTLVIDVTRAGLLHSLLSKPQALWVKPTTYARFEAVLPTRFKSAILHENFFLMSLFADERPIGMVFCDRAQAVAPLDKASFLGFKSAILLTIKALGFLAQGKRQPGAQPA